MKKPEITTRTVLYEANSSVKHIETDGNNADYIHIQHKHIDYQLRLITKGEGVCLVGSYLVSYKEGDILLMGSNVPHCTSLFSYKEASQRSESEVIQFHPDLFPQNAAHIPEYYFIHRLMLQSQYGLQFSDPKLAKKTAAYLKQLRKKSGIEKICTLLEMLEVIAHSNGNTIAEEVFDPNDTFCNTQDTLHKIYEYLYAHMKEDIKLDDISAYVGLTPASLCRSFRNKTRTTIFQFLNKIRIDNVCKLLIYTDLAIAQAAYESGFNSMAFFNKQFKKRLKMSPSEYKNQVFNESQND